MQLYNTLGRKLQDLREPDNTPVKLYTCGPTVYHYAHIGNLRNVIFNDTLRRTLELSGYQVKHVMNITDVGHLVSDADDGQDKLEKGAAREGKTVWEVADYYIDAFNRHTTTLNVLPPTKTVRATDAIDSQIEIVHILLEKEIACITQQAIYFDVTKLDDYGKLSGQKLSDKEVGARREVVTDSEKRHPQDFALWFFTVDKFADHQMHWPTPWGEGFPGWHLECSAIIHQELGETIDIHTGGVDHIGTHHTNEIAQSEAAFDKPLADFWVHNEFLHQDGGKMSKSGNETITLDDVIKRGYDPLALRLFYLQSHYRSQANFSWKSLDDTSVVINKFYAWADLKFQFLESQALRDNYIVALSVIKKEMEDDLKTPSALAFFNGMTSRVAELGIDSEAIKQAAKVIDDYFGLNLENRLDVNSEQKAIIAEHSHARENKEWVKSDKLRDKLLKQGVGLRDTKQGSIWYRL